MANYTLDFTTSSPGKSITLMEFSPDGRFLAVGDRDPSFLFILDRLTGFNPTVSAATPTEPTALVWESSKAFYAGTNDGRFIHYRVDLGEERLVRGVVNSLFRGKFPITAIALDAESKMLVFAVGPDIFASRRIRATNEFCLVARVSALSNFTKDPGNASPFPRSICFSLDNKLVVTFCRWHIVSIVLELDGSKLYMGSFQTARIDHSGLPVLKALTSTSDNEIHRLARLWVYGDAHQVDSDRFSFLFIDGGAATLSSSALGHAVVRDAITRREIQLLEHTSIAGRRVSVMGHHVSNDKYNIATADRGVNATIKIWGARRPPTNDQDCQSQYGFLARRWWILAALLFGLVIVTVKELEWLSTAEKISKIYFQIGQVCIGILHLILDAAEAISGIRSRP